MRKEKTLRNMHSVVLWCFTLIGISNAAFKLEERYSWNQMDFVFPTRAMKGIRKIRRQNPPTHSTIYELKINLKYSK